MEKIDRHKIVWTERDPVHLNKCFSAEINGALVRVGQTVRGEFYWFAANGKCDEYCSSRASAEQDAVNYLNGKRENRMNKLLSEVEFLNSPVSYAPTPKEPSSE